MAWMMFAATGLSFVNLSLLSGKDLGFYASNSGVASSRLRV